MDQETKAIEKGLAKQIRRFFTGLQRKIIKEYSDTSEEYLSLLQLQLQIIIEKEWRKYENVLLNYNQKAAAIGLLYNKLLTDYSFIHAREVGLAAKSENMKDIFSTNESVSDKIMNNTFEASDKVKSRVTNEINNVLADAYRDGLGREDVTKKINEKFTQLKTYESRRIAVTEINSNRNVANYAQIQNDGVKYKQWVTAEDGRVRPTHMDLNGHIVRTSDKFSNGLAHPGDKNGPIREWVNCRCVLLPYFIPWGKKAPDLMEFTEEQLLVDNDVGSVEDYLKKFGKPVEPVAVEVESTVGGDVVVQGNLNGTKIKPISSKYLTSDEDIEVFLKLSTPEECADFFRLKYRPQKNRITGKVESMIFEDPVNKTEIYFDNYFVNGKGKKVLDMKNGDNANYNLKDILRYYNEAPQAYKECTGSIAIVKRGRRASPLALADTNTLRWQEGNKRHFNRINMYDSTFEESIFARGNPQQSMYHEMGHTFDFSYMNKTAVEKYKSGSFPGSDERMGLSKDKWKDVRFKQNEFQKKNGYEIRKASWYGEDKHGAAEDFAETMSMAAFDKNPNKTLANMQYKIAEYDYKTVPYDDWLPSHRPTYDYCVELLKNYNPAERTFVQKDFQYTIREALLDEKINKAKGLEIRPTSEQIAEYKRLSLTDNLNNKDLKKLDSLDEIIRLSEYTARNFSTRRFLKAEYEDFKKLYNKNQKWFGSISFDDYVEGGLNKSIQKIHKNDLKKRKK